MKKYSFWFMYGLLLIIALPAISWVSVNNKAHIPFIAPITKPSDNILPPPQQLFDNYVSNIYDEAGLSKSNLDLEVFKTAIIGYYNLREVQLVSPQKSIITIIDFNKSSRQKRLWVIDLDKKKLLFNTLVAHGQGSGEDMAYSFSNRSNSHQSSLGFYITSDTYFGKNGFSIKLDGMDEGFNTNAKERLIVIHGANYVSQDFIKQNGYLGRSHGCPALPLGLTEIIINTIKNHTCLYINGYEKNYTSIYSDQFLAANNFLSTPALIQASL